MNKYLNKKTKKAFTLVEITIVIIVITVLVLFTTLSSAKSDTSRYKKISAFSSNFYAKVSNAYQDILMNNATNYTLEKLKDSNSDDVVDSVDLATYFARLLEGEIIEANAEPEEGEGEGEGEEEQEAKPSVCDVLKVGNGATLSQNAICVDFNKIIAGFVYDGTCSLSVDTKEFLSKDEYTKITESKITPQHRNVANACGYVVYTFQDSRGEFKKDLFTIALGKRNIK